MTSIWDLALGREGAEVPSVVQLDTGGTIPPNLPNVLRKLNRCGLGSGHVLLSLIAEREVDPWNVWEILWRDAAEFPEIWHKDGKPDILFVQNFGFFPFGERTQENGAEGLFVVDLRTSAYCFLRQTQTMGVNSAMLQECPEPLRILLKTACAYYSGDYCPVWVMQPEDLERQIGTLPENDPKRNLFVRDLYVQEQIRGGIRLAKEQWELERFRLQIDETTTPGPSVLGDAQDVLSNAQERAPTFPIPPGVHIESPTEEET